MFVKMTDWFGALALGVVLLIIAFFLFASACFIGRCVFFPGSL